MGNFVGVRKESIMSDIKVKVGDMEDEMKEEAVHIALESIKKFSIERDIAEEIKKHFDTKYQPAWHCIVGKDFGSFVTHETKSFLFVTINDLNVMLWKNGISSS